MILYILKSATCLALLLAFYHLVLEREKMHNFNRFYLLGSVLFSFLAPLYIIYIDVAPLVLKATPTTSFSYPTEITPEIIIEKSIDYTLIFIGMYSLISSILFIRFGKNLFHIIQKIRKNEQVKYQKAVLVLVDNVILPHTFWNYIFINKNDFENQKIEQELFTHELTHVTQKHTLDVLFLEFLQAIFWINPFFILLKKAVQLNHEFLADETVINQHKNTIQYQHLLLNKAAWKNDYYLASNLNYSLTKKRLKMMTTQSSQTKIWLKKLVVFPLLAGFIFLFAERVEAQEVIYEQSNKIQNEKSPSSKKETHLETIKEKALNAKGDEVNTGFLDINNITYYFVTINKDTKYYNKDGKLANSKGEIISNKKSNASDIIPGNYIKKTYYKGKVFCEFIKDKPENIKILVKELQSIKDFKKLSPIEFIKNNKDAFYYYNDNQITYEKVLHLIKNKKTINIETQDIDGKTLIKKLENINTSIKKSKASKKEMKEYKALFEEGKKHNIYKLKNIKKMQTIYSLMSKKQKNSVQNISKIIPPPPPPKNNTSKIKETKKIEEIDELFKLSKIQKDSLYKYKKINSYYEATRNKKPHYVDSDEERKEILEGIFSELGSRYFNLSKEDKKKAKRPVLPHDPYVALRKNNKVFYKLKKDLTEEDKLLIPPPPPVPNATKEEIEKAKNAYEAWKKRTANDFTPPPPPPVKKKQETPEEIKFEKKSIVDFNIEFEKSDNLIKMKCLKGCNWKTLNFTMNENTNQVINRIGMNESEKSEFIFFIQNKNNKIQLKSMKGTAWETLEFTLNNKAKVNQFGVTAY